VERHVVAYDGQYVYVWEPAEDGQHGAVVHRPRNAPHLMTDFFGPIHYSEMAAAVAQMCWMRGAPGGMAQATHIRGQRTAARRTRRTRG